MLTGEENERLTRVGRGTPWGSWCAGFGCLFCWSRIYMNLMGPRCGLLCWEKGSWRFATPTVASGSSTVTARTAAPTSFGRNEEGGLRCTYHGWKYDVDGKCLDMPTEDAGSTFKNNIKLASYPVREGAGVLWTIWDRKIKFHSCRNLSGPGFRRGTDSFRGTTSKITLSRPSMAASTPSTLFFDSTLDSHRKLDEWQEQGKRDGNPRLVHRVRTNPPKLVAKDTDYGVIIGGKYKGSDGTGLLALQ